MWRLIEVSEFNAVPLTDREAGPIYAHPYRACIYYIIIKNNYHTL